MQRYFNAQALSEKITPGEYFQVTTTVVFDIGTIRRREFHSGVVMRNGQHQLIVVINFRSDYNSAAVPLSQRSVRFSAAGEAEA